MVLGYPQTSQGSNVTVPWALPSHSKLFKDCKDGVLPFVLEPAPDFQEEKLQHFITQLFSTPITFPCKITLPVVIQSVLFRHENVTVYKCIFAKCIYNLYRHRVGNAKLLWH